MERACFVPYMEVWDGVIQLFSDWSCQSRLTLSHADNDRLSDEWCVCVARSAWWCDGENVEPFICSFVWLLLSVFDQVLVEAIWMCKLCHKLFWEHLLEHGLALQVETVLVSVSPFLKKRPFVSHIAWPNLTKIFLLPSAVFVGTIFGG